MAGKFNHGHLHAEAYAKVGHVVLACVPDRGDLALDTAVAEAAGNEDRIEPDQ